jgi:hypothetical protein
LTSVSPLGVAGTAALPSNYLDPKIAELPQHEKAILDLLGLK